MITIIMTDHDYIHDYNYNDDDFFVIIIIIIMIIMIILISRLLRLS